MKKNFLLCLCLLLLSRGFAQNNDLRGALQQIRAYYASPALKHAGGTMTLKQPDGRLLDKVSFAFWLEGDLSYAKMNYLEVLRGGDAYVLVNHKNKTVFARPLSVLQPITGGLQDPGQLQKLLETPGLTGSVTTVDSLQQVHLTGFRGSRIRELTLTVSAADHHIHRLRAKIAGATGASDLEIRYDKNELLPAGSRADIFDTARFATIQGKAVRLAPAFSAYKKL